MRPWKTKINNPPYLRSGRAAMIVARQPAEPLAAFDLAGKNIDISRPANFTDTFPQHPYWLVDRVERISYFKLTTGF